MLYWERDRTVFMKYNFELDTEGSNSLSIIIKQLKKNSTILEFGPANGRLTRYMKEELNCQVYLVELDENAGREALNFGVDLVVGDIEVYEWKERYRDIKFDHIIFADVLEHLRDPLKVLRTAKEFLKEDGTILLSVPNLAHNSVLIDLMNNKFEYNSIGLLDDTHIHFFTKTSLDKMVEEAGLYTSKEMATYAKVGTTEIKNSIDDVNGIKPAYWNTRPYGQVYQFVYELAKSQTDIEKDIDEPKEDYWFQIYYDNEGKWDKKKSIKKTIDISKEEHYIEIDLPEKVNFVRIDPLNKNCIIKILEVFGEKEEKRIDTVRKVSNEKSLFQEIYFFDNNDPQLHYCVSEYVDKLKIRYKILDVDINASNATQMITDSINKLSDNNHNLQVENEQIRQRLQYEKERADILQAQRDRLENKKLYKIYKFFKRR